jgi:hypothetical protein
MTDDERKEYDRNRARAYRAAHPDKVRTIKKACYAKHGDRYRSEARADYAANLESIRARKKAWRRANPEKSSAYTMKWYVAHRDQVREKRKADRLANIEAARACDKAVREANQERVRAAQHKYRAAHPEVGRAAMRAWQRSNRPIVNAHAGKRRAARQRATPDWASQTAIAEIYAEAVHLTKTTGIPHEVDHIYPLISRVVCGLHVEANLQILTKTANAQKHNRISHATSWNDGHAEHPSLAPRPYVELV